MFLRAHVLTSAAKTLEPGPEAWLSRAGSQCVRYWERWLSPVRRQVARMFGLFAIHVSDAWSYCVTIHSCVAIPHCVGISSCVNNSVSRCILPIFLFKSERRLVGSVPHHITLVVRYQ